ncbi:hypothetical protein Leryth_016575 [Lithospermum erythrorhizon]|nr:hypothetical protein Leryth_016575 [Lithospermum erythrorhizon]
MSSNPNCSVYIGNLDERVSDRVLYDILIQAGRVVDLNIPKDRESGKAKGFAFAEYETKEIAEYAVRLFSGLVTLYNRTLKFAISGKDKPSPNLSTATPTQSSYRPRPPAVPYNDLDSSLYSARLLTSCRFSEQVTYSQEPAPPGISEHQYNGYRSHYESNGYDYNGRVLGTTLDTYSGSRSDRCDSRNSTNYN